MTRIGRLPLWRCGAGARLRGRRAQKYGDAAAQGLGRSRGGFSTKLHVLVDALGNPLRFTLTSGAAGDNPQAIPLLTGIQAGEVMADRGDDADKTLAYIAGTMGAVATIPPKRSRTVQRDCDYAAYRERHLVECLIGKLKHFLAFVHLASTLIWLK